MRSPDNDRRTLAHIIRYCEKIGATVARFGPSFEDFACDPDSVDSVSMNILQIGELAGALSGDYVERTRRAMDWRSIKGMRNIFAHDYGSMDLERTWYTAVTDVPALKEFCQGELARMDGE